MPAGLDPIKRNEDFNLGANKKLITLKSVFINSDKQAKTTAFFQMALKDVLRIIKGSHRLFGIVENGIIQCSHKRLQDSFKRSTAPCF